MIHKAKFLGYKYPPLKDQMVHKRALKLLTVIVLFLVLYCQYHRTLKMKSILSPNEVFFLAVLEAKENY